LVLAFVLLAVFSPAAATLFWAILVPIWFFFAGTVSILLRLCRDKEQIALTLFYSVLPARAPPFEY